ncbi:uncharacterized protein LOC134229691 [Saccostrea cucullata]|uniref:uncharacterized protein LOC134229691 n=1 Tax=Saccostrea cuccullata TaxID=36930 RepID=UPI002ED5B965
MLRGFISLLLLICTLNRAAADHLSKDPPPGESTDPQLQIVYNDRLREVMRKFNITEADMNMMLSNFVEGGKSPTITKSVLNSNTGLQETITLDFQGFTNEWISQKKIQVQNILNEYETAMESTPNAVMARRDSSRVISTGTSGPVAEVAPTQQVVLENEPIKNDEAQMQEKLAQLEELRNQNALLNLRLREEQEMLSPSANGILQRPQTPLSFSTSIPEGRGSSARAPESVRERLLAEYRALQNRKRNIYQLLQRYKRLLL